MPNDPTDWENRKRVLKDTVPCQKCDGDGNDPEDLSAQCRFCGGTGLAPKENTDADIH